VEGHNRLMLEGTLARRDALRHTPAGIAIVNFQLMHASTQPEGGALRQVELEMACIALEELARLVSGSPMGARMSVAGFLAPQGRSSRRPVLHVTELKFTESLGD
jgi:primosomal replication protein N